MSNQDRANVKALRKRFKGEVLLPGDPAYDTTRRVWNAMVDRRPAVIARCSVGDDVVEAVRFAREHDLEVGVRCGGHGILGAAVPEGGLMVDLTPMGGVRVDPGSRRAWVQGGALLGALDRATQAYGLGVTAGNVSHTGVGGLTLGGGMGWLARRYGLTCDQVDSFELVSADGQVLRVSADEHEDLFWGLRGGGGNFGIVTEFEFRLHEIGTSALVVELWYPADEAANPMRGWRDLLAEASRQATYTAWVGSAREAPSPADGPSGGSLASIGYVWVGDPDAGLEPLGPLRALGTPLFERIRGMTYLELQTMDDTVEEHAIRRYWKGHYLRELTDEAIEAFLLRGMARGEDGSLAPAASLQAYGGAIAEVAPEATAFSQRDALVEFVAASRWTDPGEDDARIAAARRYGASIERFASGSYVNALVDEGEIGVRRAYRPGQLARLTALKDTYDPDNVFHLNHNIPPSARKVTDGANKVRRW